MRPERLMSRRSRRMLILTAVASLIALIVWGITRSNAGFGLIPFFIYGAVLYRLEAAIGRPYRRATDLDERQRGARDRAHRHGNVAMSVALLLALIPALLLDGVHWPTPDARTVPVVVFGLIAIVHPFLPWAILAWTEPDPIPLETDARSNSDRRPTEH